MDDFDLNEWINTEYRRVYEEALAQARAQGARSVELIDMGVERRSDDGSIVCSFEWQPVA